MIGKIAKMYPTSITPDPSFIAIYIVAIYFMQVGYCVLLTVARKSETKVCITLVFEEHRADEIPAD